MIEKINLYISAAPDLASERDLLGKVVTEIPIDIGWWIIQTPIRGEPVDLDAVIKADIHLLLLGSDIRAPVGLEWLAATRAGHLPMLYLKGDINRTMAAEDFIRHLAKRAAWHPFVSSTDLRRQVLKLHADHLLTQAFRYSLTTVEVDRLQTWLKGVDESPEAKAEEGRTVAGESSVILTSERYNPTGGVLLKPHDL